MSQDDNGGVRSIGWFGHPRAGRSAQMAKLITGDRLLDAIRTQDFIKNGSEICAEGAKYDFRMGTRLLKYRQGNLDTTKLTETERSQLCLEPGEIAFVLTEETLDLSDRMIAMLSPKRKLSHDGILVLGHSSISTTQRYVHVSKEHLKTALSQRHPNHHLCVRIESPTISGMAG